MIFYTSNSDGTYSLDTSFTQTPSGGLGGITFCHVFDDTNEMQIAYASDSGLFLYQRSGSSWDQWTLDVTRAYSSVLCADVNNGGWDELIGLTTSSSEPSIVYHFDYDCVLIIFCTRVVDSSWGSIGFSGTLDSYTAPSVSGFVFDINRV